jgi:hypothetical protein
MVATIHTKIIHYLYVKSIKDNASKIDNVHAVGNILTAFTTHVFEDAI